MNLDAGGSRSERDGDAPGIPPAPSLPVEYDVSTTEQVYSSQHGTLRRSTLLLVPLMVVLAGIVIYEAFSYPAGSQAFWARTAAGGAILAMGVGLGLLAGGYAFSRGPTRVLLDSSGVELRYRSGKTRRLDWTDPSIRIRLSDFRGSPVERVRAVPIAVDAGGEQFRVPTEVGDALLAVAFQRAETILSKQLPSFVKGRTIPLWDIRGTRIQSPPKGWNYTK